MKIKTADGTWITGKTAADVVRQMHEFAEFAKAPTDQDWMELASARAATQSGAVVRTGTPEEFLADLAKARMIQMEDAA